MTTTKRAERTLRNAAAMEEVSFGMMLLRIVAGIIAVLLTLAPLFVVHYQLMSQRSEPQPARQVEQAPAAQPMPRVRAAER